MAKNYCQILDGNTISPKIKKKIMTQEEREKRRQETLRKMRAYKLHVSEVDILEEAGEL